MAKMSPTTPKNKTQAQGSQAGPSKRKNDSPNSQIVIKRSKLNCDQQMQEEDDTSDEETSSKKVLEKVSVQDAVEIESDQESSKNNQTEADDEQEEESRVKKNNIQVIQNFSKLRNEQNLTFYHCIHCSEPNKKVNK